MEFYSSYRHTHAYNRNYIYFMFPENREKCEKNLKWGDALTEHVWTIKFNSIPGDQTDGREKG